MRAHGPKSETGHSVGCDASRLRWDPEVLWMVPEGSRSSKTWGVGRSHTLGYSGHTVKVLNKQNENNF